MTSSTAPTTPPPPPDWEKIARYLAGEASPDEAAAVRRWLDAHPADASAIAALDAATKGLAPARTVDVEAALRNVKTRPPAGSRGRFTVRIAVATLAAAAALTFVMVRGDRGPDAAPDGAAVRMLATDTGARDTVLLADGTRIILGPTSRMRVNETAREIELTGQAFFTIQHDGARPYAVRANGVVIRDIGTEFGVRGYDGEALRVVVTHGAVELERDAQKVMLDSGDVGVVEPDGRMARSADAVTSADLAWTSGQLVFRDASMAQVRADLRRWYGVELLVRDSALERRHFSGIVYTSEPVDRVAQTIALSLGARAEQHGDTISISPTRQR